MAINRIGDIYKFNTTKLPRYMQFIGRDQFQLNSDVIVVFKYVGGSEPSIGEVVQSGPDFFTHTTVSAGVKQGLWTKIGKASPAYADQAYFKTGDYDKPDDYDLESGRVVTQHDQWHIWRLGDYEPHFVGADVEHTPTAWLGSVFPPAWIPYRVDNGEFDIAPDYGYRY